MPEVERQLRDIFGAVLGCDTARLTPQSSQQTVAGWDSVNHMQLLLTIEDTFGIQFSPEEFASLTTFGALVGRLENGGPAA